MDKLIDWFLALHGFWQICLILTLTSLFSIKVNVTKE